MQIAAATNLACPIDGLPIDTHGTQRRCAAGHCFDMARAGYCNLLVVQHKASRDPGDSKDMVAARRRFLEAGHFQPIADHVFNAARKCVTAAEDGAFNVVDAGCGEGYYLERLARLTAASPEPGTLGLAGIDVSKWAVKAAARRKAPVTWLVANNRTPPFLAGSVDLVLCLFGFPVWEGFQENPETRWPRAARGSGRRPPARAARDHLPDCEAFAASPARGCRGGGVSTAARGRVAVFRDADRSRDDPGSGGDDAPCASRGTGGAKGAG